MNKIITFGFLMVICLIASNLRAEIIYLWTDDNGVKHFTNQNPPEHAEIIMKTKAIPFDEEADRLRREAEMKEQAERTRLELAEREAELERREWEAEKRLANANQRAEEALSRAENLIQAAENSDDSSSRSGYYSYPGYYRYPYYERWYYRQDGNIYYKRKKPSISHYQSYEKHAGQSPGKIHSSENERLKSNSTGRNFGLAGNRSSLSRADDMARNRGVDSGARIRGIGGRR